MLPKIKSIEPIDGYLLRVSFDDGKSGTYDVNSDIADIESYRDLATIEGLFQQARLDESRTCVYWNDRIDLPSDTIYEHTCVA